MSQPGHSNCVAVLVRVCAVRVGCVAVPAKLCRVFRMHPRSGFAVGMFL